MHHQRSRHLHAREVHTVAHVVHTIGHALVRLDLLYLAEIFADMLCRGGVVSPQRHPRGAVAGDGRSILNAVGRLKLGVALEAEDTAASILPRAGKEVAERGQTLERRQLVDDAIERSEEHTSELQSLMRISYAV